MLAHELCLPFAPRAVAAALALGRTRLVWPGRVLRPEGAELMFLQMLGAGFDAQVVHGLQPWLKRGLGPTAYMAQGLREIVRYRFAPIRIEVDGTPIEAGSVIVSKGRLYGGRYQLAPEARPGMRGFTVAVFDRSGPWSALMYGAALPLNLLPHMPGLRLLRASEITVSSAHVPAQTDGDPAGEAPLTVTESPAAYFRGRGRRRCRPGNADSPSGLRVRRGPRVGTQP